MQVLLLGRNCQLLKCRVKNNWLATRKRTWGCTGSQVEHESVSCCFAEKANILLGCLNRSLSERHKVGIHWLYLLLMYSLCRQHLFWVPRFKKNLDHLEGVQSREMRVIRV